MVFHLLFLLGGRSISPVVRDVFALVMKCSHIMFALSSAWCSMNRSYSDCQKTFILEVSCNCGHIIQCSVGMQLCVT